MKLGWGLKGIRPEARDAAKEAARRAGMSVEDWLNSAISHTATQMGVPPGGHASLNAFSSVNQRLDDLNRRIAQASQGHPGHAAHPGPRGPEAYAPPHQRPPQTIVPQQFSPQLGYPAQPFHPAQAHVQAQAQAHAQGMAFQQAAPLPQIVRAPATAPFARPPAPPVQWQNQPNPGIDHAVAQIAARQQALGVAARPAPAFQAPPPQAQPARPAPAAAPQQPAPRQHVPAQDLSGLEEQLRTITSQIETLRRPGVEEAINALRAELGEISRTVNDAMPRRAIETIEAEIHGLNARVAEGRQAGADGEALAGIEHGLMEVRDVLHQLTPAESLVGFNDAIHTLASKIDAIVAQQDPATMRQLEEAVMTLRDISQHIASNEMVGRLAQDVEALADKVDRIANAAGAGDALANLEHRIAALSDALAERSESGAQVPPRLENLVASLSDKIEKIQSHGSEVAAGHLEDRIVQLVERLDASDSRLGHLEAIERGLADLLVHIDDIRSQQPAAAPSPHVDELRTDIGRTKIALDAVHGTLGHVVDRLASIEKEMRREVAPPVSEPPPARKPAARKSSAQHVADFDDEDEPLELPVSRIAVRAVPVETPPAPVQSLAPAAPPAPAAMPPQIDPFSFEAPASFEAPMSFEAPISFEAPMPPQAPPEPAFAAPVFSAAAFTRAEPELPPAPQFTPPPVIPAAIVNAPVQPEPVRPFAPTAQPGVQPAQRPLMPQGKRKPINPDLAPDMPLEPGTRQAAISIDPASRIAASEADLGDARPKDEAPAGGKSFILAAARKAAKMAMRDKTSRDKIPRDKTPRAPKAPKAPAEDRHFLDDGIELPRATLATRIKKVLIAASVIAIVVGLIQIAATFFDLGRTHGPQTKPAAMSDSDTAPAAAASDDADAATQAPAGDITKSTDRIPDSTSKVLQAFPSAAMSSVPGILSPTPAIPTPRTPAQTMTAPAEKDVTGSISTPDTASAINEKLPVAIGGPNLRNAALAGDATAAYEIAVRFAEGRNVPANPADAARWFERAAAKGIAPAQFRLASMFEKGQGVRKDLTRARKLYMSAADAGNAKAMHNLAVLNAEGASGRPDYDSAAQWFKKAAEYGVSDSQYNLGILYARGLGVEKNFSESYKWFSLASLSGDPEAGKKRDDVAAQLDARSRAQADKTIKTWTPQKQRDSATNVATPPGGWDQPAAEAPAAKVRSASPGSFALGKR